MRLPALALALAALVQGSAHAQTAAPEPAPLVVYAAGSMTGALGAMLQRYSATTGVRTRLQVGPAGLMLDKIEAGDPVDLFVSANMAHPERLTREGKSTATVVMARNRLCVSGRPTLGLTSSNLLDRLLDPKVRIGASTPGADPGGDYAWALFDKAGTVRPGADGVLKAKARQVVGGKIERPAPKAAAPATALASLDRYGVDVMIGYCSSHDKTPDASVTRVEVPPELAVPVDYGMTALTTSADPARREAGARLALFLMSPAAQALMLPYGFIPVAASPSARADPPV
jgi:molybdate transport system substrate-binding protein